MVRCAPCWPRGRVSMWLFMMTRNEVRLKLEYWRRCCIYAKDALFKYYERLEQRTEYQRIMMRRRTANDENTKYDLTKSTRIIIYQWKCPQKKGKGIRKHPPLLENWYLCDIKVILVEGGKRWSDYTYLPSKSLCRLKHKYKTKKKLRYETIKSWWWETFS